MSFVQQLLLTLEQFFTTLARMCANATKPASKLTAPPVTQPQKKTAASKLTEPPVTQPQKKTMYCGQAVSNQDFPLLRQLVKDGADVNAAPEEGKAVPLEIAVTKGNVEMTKFLLQQGAKLDRANSHGCTPLHLATFHKLLPVAYVLLEAGADTKLKSKNGNTALDLAKDDAAKCLLTIYASGGRPSWLARELYQRGLGWDVIVAADAKMQKEGYSTRESLVVMPLTSFTDAYLKYDIGITSSLAREMIFQIRVESTWLGCELAKKGVNAINIAICEKVIIDKWSRTSEALFASLKITDLTFLHETTARHADESLIELHREVNKKSLPTAAPHTETKTKTANTVVDTETAPTAVSSVPAVSPLKSAIAAPAVNTKVATMVFSTVLAPVAVATAPTAVSSVPSGTSLTPTNPVPVANTVEIIPGTVMKSPAQSESSTTDSVALTNDVTAAPHQPAVEPAAEPTTGTPAETRNGERNVHIVQHIDAGGAVSGEPGTEGSSAEGDGAHVDRESESGSDERDSGTWEHLVCPYK